MRRATGFTVSWARRSEGETVKMINGYEKYRTQSVLTASPQELVLMLYDNCLKHLAMARTDISRERSLAAREHLLKAQDLVAELMNGLDFQYEVAGQLYQLYEYINHELMLANVDQDIERITGVEPLLNDLRQTWQETIVALQTDSPSALAGNG